MKQLELKNTLVTVFKAGKRVAIQSGPGVGKTSIVKEAAEEAGVDLILDHPAISDPTDYKGLPVMQKDGGAKFAPIGLLARLLKVTKPTLVLLDDYGQAAHSVQAATMQLIHGGELGGVKIPPCVNWCLATNGTGDRAAVNAILEPVKSRFHSLLTLECDLNDWTAWAVREELPEEIIAFIRFRPDLLNKFEPSREWKNCPSPRTVAQAAELFALGIVNKEALAGACGEGWALDFLSYLRVYQDLPSIDGIILDPHSAKVPTTIGARWAVSSGLSRRAKKDNLARIITYLARLTTECGSKDFEQLTMRDIYRGKPEATQCVAFSQWASLNESAL